MAVRHVEAELEAKLRGAGGGYFSKPSGKLERKRYRGGDERLTVVVRNLDAPTGALAIVVADGEALTEISVVDGAGSVDLESTDGAAVPALRAGQVIEVRVGGAVVLRGELAED